MTSINTNSFPVYPSQKAEFKNKAKKISWALCQAKLIPDELSAFKRNDSLAHSLGYKSHSDLVSSTASRVQADKAVPLMIYSNEVVANSIATTFWKKYCGSRDTQSLFLSIVKQLGHQELNPEPSHKLYISFNLTINGILFFNINHSFFIDIDWSDCLMHAKHFGVKGKDDLITLLGTEVDSAILIDGLEEESKSQLNQGKSWNVGIIVPLIRSIYYGAEDNHREMIGELPHQKNLKSLLDEIAN